jgi:chromatin remodeling complex protein RSC6
VVEEHVTDIVPSSSRKVITQDTVMDSFDTLIKFIEASIVDIREDKSNTKGIKFLRSLNKDIKLIQSQTVRVLKQKDKKPRKPSNNTNSGFNKPVAISSDLAKFVGWKDDELHSRVDVTTYICDYIKKNNLQDPTDGRKIHPDDKLRKLLGISDGPVDEPLKYYSIQTHLKSHYPR